MTSRSIDFPRGRFVRLTRANSFRESMRVVIPGQDGSCRDNKKRKKSNEGEGQARLNVLDAEKSPLFFLDASRPRMQLVVSLKDFSVFDERVFASWNASFGKNSPSSRQINSSTLIYLRRVIRWLSRLLALICSCLRDICSLSVKFGRLQCPACCIFVLDFGCYKYRNKSIHTHRCYAFIK